MLRFLGVLALIAFTFPRPATGQAIEFESKGLMYQTLTKSGVTVMFARLPSHVREYTILQAAVSNGSAGRYVIRPEDFTYMRSDGEAVRGTPASAVITELIEKGGRSDVIKLVTAYEAALYGIPHMKSTNGYEARRQNYLAVTATKLKSAAAASALALVQTKIEPGESTDGAVFFATAGRPLGPGRLVVRTNTDVFEFNPEP